MIKCTYDSNVPYLHEESVCDTKPLRKPPKKNINWLKGMNCLNNTWYSEVMWLSRLCEIKGEHLDSVVVGQLGSVKVIKES